MWVEELDPPAGGVEAVVAAVPQAVRETAARVPRARARVRMGFLPEGFN